MMCLLNAAIRPRIAIVAAVSTLSLAVCAPAQDTAGGTGGPQPNHTGMQTPAADKMGGKMGMDDKANGGMMSAEQTVMQWPAICQKAYKEMVDKYGQPDGVTSTKIVWTNKGPFKEIVLINQAFNHQFPKVHEDCLEHVVELKVPKEKVGELAEFDGSVIVDRTRGTIGARCDSEAHNLLALNLAHGIIAGQMSVSEARKKYTEGAEAETAGKPPEPIATKLLFQPVPNGGDPDMKTVKN